METIKIPKYRIVAMVNLEAGLFDIPKLLMNKLKFKVKTVDKTRVELVLDECLKEIKSKGNKIKETDLPKLVQRKLKEVPVTALYGEVEEEIEESWFRSLWKTVKKYKIAIITAIIVIILIVLGIKYDKFKWLKLAKKTEEEILKKAAIKKENKENKSKLKLAKNKERQE